MDNSIQSWAQGRFVDGPEYRNASHEQKAEWQRGEEFLVRPGAKENAICSTFDPEHAKWIAQRLNLASKLEQMTYDFAAGKSDGSEIVAFVRKNIDA